ncbi:MAG: hypothetical protein AAGC55_21460 [Myxococcota bacterium]
MISKPIFIVAALAAIVGACAEDPQYMQRDVVLEVGAPDSEITVATDVFVLPIRLENETEAMERAELEVEAGMPVPRVSLADVSISVEWIVRNLSGDEGTARVAINGGNETFQYVPDDFVIDPDEDETPPSLVGGVPFTVAAGASVSGVLREDQLREGGVDLELISRGGVNPFAAILENHNDLAPLVVDGGPLPLPASLQSDPEPLLGHIVQLEVTLSANRHMAMEYVVRVRDHNDRLHEMLLDAPAAELTAFAPMRPQPVEDPAQN